MKKRTKKKIGIGIATAVFVVAGINIYLTQSQYATADAQYDDIASSVQIADTPVEAVPVEETEETTEDDFTAMDNGPHYDIGTYPNLVIDHAALKAANPDYKGWLYVPCLEISYPVVRGTDNDYYLHHTYEGTENVTGCIFIDSGCAKDMGDYNTFFYGHNMKNGSMFGSLKKLLSDPDPIIEDPYIYFYTEDGVYAYRTYSFHKVPPKSDYFEYAVTQRKYWNYIDKALQDRVQDMDTAVDKRKNSVTLSTCNGSGESRQRFLVHAINIGFYKPA
ncbi:MAG: class B sortase [Lachnospiraceae bacterium]|nr:class B sortase [Lachnospiraceae bacterium]